MSKTMMINGRLLHYDDTGGTGDTIIAIHGLSGNYKQMHFFAQHFKKRYRFISIDAKGRGKSEAQKPSSYTVHSEDIALLVEKLAVERPILLGFSMGAFIMAHAATKLSNVQKLVLIDGGAHVGEHQRKLITPSIARLSQLYKTPEHYVEEMKALYRGLHISWSDALTQAAYYELEQTVAGWQTIARPDVIRDDFESLMMFPHKQIFSSIACPIFVVHCEGKLQQAPLFRAEDFCDMLTSASSIEKMTAPCNHYSVACEPQPTIYTEIERFLQK